MQQPTVIVARAPTPALGPIRGSFDLDICEKLRTSRLPYGPHPSAVPLTPSVNRWVGRLRGGVELGRGFTDAHRSARNKNIARISMLHKCSLLCKKVAARPPKPQYLDKPIPPHVDDQPKATDPVPVAPVDRSSQKKKRTYYGRLHVTRASPYSQRGPSEVPLLACKEVLKYASLRKASIWQCHLAARDRGAAGTDGRINVVYQKDPITGQQAVAGSRQQPAPSQRKTPVGDHVYPRRKRPTAANFIRAKGPEKEGTLDATADALQSMGLKSEASIPASSNPASSSYALAPGAPESSSMPSSSSVVQDPEFNQDQAQLFLEDISEAARRTKTALWPCFPRLYLRPILVLILTLRLTMAELSGSFLAVRAFSWLPRAFVLLLFSCFPVSRLLSAVSLPPSPVYRAASPGDGKCGSSRISHVACWPGYFPPPTSALIPSITPAPPLLRGRPLRTGYCSCTPCY